MERVPNSAHLIAAGAFLAREGDEAHPIDGEAIWFAAWVAPEAILALASGFLEFGLSHRPHGQKQSFLRLETVWHLAAQAQPATAFLPSRRLTLKQVEFLVGRLAVKKR